MKSSEESAVTLNLVVQRDAEGVPFHEEVLATRTDTNRYRLLKSPGLVPGMAAGDDFEIVPGAPNGYRIIRRAGNVAVQFFTEHELDEVAAFILSRVQALGGWLDGRATKLLVLTIPVGAGFPAIGKVFEAALVRFPESEWMYGNVYSTADGKTPLDWWK